MVGPIDLYCGGDFIVVAYKGLLICDFIAMKSVERADAARKQRSGSLSLGLLEFLENLPSWLYVRHTVLLVVTLSELESNSFDHGGFRNDQPFVNISPI
jgi:hypothetical protein